MEAEGESRKRPVALFVSILAVVVVVGAIGLVFFSAQLQQIKQLRDELSASQQQAAQLESQSRELNQQLEELLKERKAASERVTSLRTQLSSATTELEQSRQRLEELQGRYDALAAEQVQDQARLAAVTGERDEAKRAAQRLEQEKGTLQRSVTRLRERLAWLDRDYRQAVEKLAQMESTSQHNSPPTPAASRPDVSAAPPASSSALRPSASAMAGTVELPPIIVRKDQAGMVIPIRGRVLEVDTQHNFMIVDRGSMDGVRMGMVFDILRGGAQIGRATVIRIRPRLTACETPPPGTSSSFQVGDVAVQGGE